jgi:tetratricopeptide (TPR) repeat protein
MDSSTAGGLLSVAVIVRDDAEALAETLVSVRGLADQSVVLDTGSSDASRTVALEAGAELFDTPWTDDFSAARNACWRHVRGSWVLWLDAGETVAAESRQPLRDLLSTGVEGDRAYALLVCVPPPVPYAAAEQIARVRLVPNHPGLHFTGRVRETLSQSLSAAGIRVEGLPYRIHRGPREHDPQRKAQRARRNLRLAQMEIGERGPLPHLLVCLGDAFQTLADNDRAARCFSQAVHAAPSGSLDMLEAYYGLLTSLDGSADQRQRQLDLAVEANSIFPLDAQLLCALGGYLQSMGQTELAQQSYETAFHYGQLNPLVWHVAEVRAIAAICWGITLQMQNKLDEAEQTLREALAACEGSVRVRRQLIELLVQRARRDEALEQVDQLPPETPHREALRSAVRGACLGVKKNWIAAKAYLQTAYHAGCRDALCMRWLATAAIAAGQLDEARQVLRSWADDEPDNPDLRKLLASVAVSTEPDEDIQRQWRIDAPGRTSPSQPSQQAAVRRPLVD